MPEFATSRWIEGITKAPNFDQTGDLGTGRAPGIQVQFEASFDAANGTRGRHRPCYP
jgi:hypothetical protein